MDGGAGTDTVQVAANTVFDPGVAFTQVETLSVLAGFTATLSTAQLSAFTTATGAVSTLVVNVGLGATYTLPNLTFTSLSVSLVGSTGDEDITGWTGAESITGLAGNDTLSGNDGNDTLSGGVGADSVVGGLGNDVFVFGATSEVSVGDRVDGTSGLDTLLVSASTDLTGLVLLNIDGVSIASGQTATFAGAQVTGLTWAVTGVLGGAAETLVVNAASGDTVNLANFTLTNAGVSLVGAAGDEVLTGSQGGDTITGGLGADIMSGGDGDDTFIYNGTPDTAVGETVNGGNGTDTVRLSSSTNLTSVTFTDVEAFSLADGATLTLTPGQIATRTWLITGTSGGATESLNVTSATSDSTSLASLTGLTNLSIFLTGALGDETLTGSTAADRITGGAGADSLIGGSGSDVFVFGSTDSGLTLGTADKIADFTSGADTLSLGLAGNATAGTGNYVEAGASVADFAAALAAANTALAALNGTSAASQLYAFEFDGTNGYLFIDTDSDGASDQVIVLAGVTNTGISAGDIVT